MVSEHIERFASIPEMHGAATVQLFNERGREILKQRQGNFISPLFLSALAKWSNSALIAPKGTNGVLGTSVITPALGLALTDYSGAADGANEQGIRGNLIAFADRWSTASGTMQGALNGVESVLALGYQKYVYDFATSAGNGTFQSIYTGPFESDAPNSRVKVNTSFDVVALSFGATLNSSWPQVAAMLGDDFYLTAGALLYKLTGTDAAKFPTSGDTSGATSLGSYSFRTSGKSVPFGGRMYWLSVSGSSLVLNSESLTSPGAVTTEKTWASAWITSKGASSASAINGIAHRSAAGTFLLGCTGGTVAFIEVDDTTYADVGVYGSSGQARYGTILAMNPDDNAIWCWNDGRVVDLARMTEGLSAVASPSPLNIALTSGDAFVINSSNSSLRFRLAQMIFSRALLPSPVTKTSSQTMKITYEFTGTSPFA